MAPLFPIPPVLKKLFDSFPLRTYAPADLPSRCPRSSEPTLHIFTASPGDKPSFQPNCLKWQTYLKFLQISFATAPSSNHASPTGSLPFLVTETNAGMIVPVHKLRAWAQAEGKPLQEIDIDEPKVQAFFTLVATKIKDAWLYALYLEPNNFASVASKQYRSTSVALVSSVISMQMQAAARDELKKYRPGGVINPEDIYADAASAFYALATVLGDDKWFFGGEDPGLFDAAVFGYTHLILSLAWDSAESELKRTVEKHGNLVLHEERIRKQFYPDSSPA